jgi:hypothetical protein
LSIPKLPDNFVPTIIDIPKSYRVVSSEAVVAHVFLVKVREINNRVGFCHGSGGFMVIDVFLTTIDSHAHQRSAPLDSQQMKFDEDGSEII